MIWNKLKNKIPEFHYRGLWVIIDFRSRVEIKIESRICGYPAKDSKC